MKDTKEKKQKEKKFYLTENEKINVESRHDLIKQYQYLMHVVNMDIRAYLQFEVLKRLNLDPETKYILSPDTTYITLPEEDHNVTGTEKQ